MINILKNKRINSTTAKKKIGKHHEIRKKKVYMSTLTTISIHAKNGPQRYLKRLKQINAIIFGFKGSINLYNLFYL